MRDLMLYCRFLHESRGGKSIWETDHHDLRAYKRARLGTDGPDAISASTGRRSIAALDKWVQWSLHEGLLTQEPFRYIDKTVMTPQGPKRVRVNAEYEVDDEEEPLHIVQFVDDLLWRNVGLRGELPDGRPDPTWRGRNAERNALFADSLVYTGMRLGEGAKSVGHRGAAAERPPRPRRRPSVGGGDQAAQGTNGLRERAHAAGLASLPRHRTRCRGRSGPRPVREGATTSCRYVERAAMP